MGVEKILDESRTKGRNFIEKPQVRLAGEQTENKTKFTQPLRDWEVRRNTTNASQKQNCRVSNSDDTVNETIFSDKDSTGGLYEKLTIVEYKPSRNNSLGF